MTTSLHEMIDKRHVGDGWFVARELGNATGYATARHADVVAIGIWPSHGYSVIGYEVKESRADLIKELKDPKKADAVGKYCDEWWLAIRDEKMLEGLVIPKTWGVLVPKNTILRVHRKAPKLKSKPMDQPFVAAVIRAVMKAWIARPEHMSIVTEIQERYASQGAAAEVSEDLERVRKDRDGLRAAVAEFEARSGVTIHKYDGGAIGDAVKLVLSLRHDVGEKAIERQINGLEAANRIARHEIDRRDNAIATLRDLLDGGKYREQPELPFSRDPVADAHGGR